MTRLSNHSPATIQRGGHTVVGFSLAEEDEPEKGASCPAALPSGDAAIRLVRGEPGAVFAVAGTMLARSALIGTGLAVAGFRGGDLLKGTIAAGLAVETFVLAWAWHNKGS
jgi:hypothetical protein